MANPTGRDIPRQTSLEKATLAKKRSPEFLVAVLNAPNLIGDRTVTTSEEHEECSCQVRLSAKLSRAIRRLSQKEGVPLSATLLAGFEILLSRYSSQDNIAVTCVVANYASYERAKSKPRGARTYTVNDTLRGNPTFSEFLRTTQTVLFESSTNNFVPSTIFSTESSLNSQLSGMPHSAKSSFVPVLVDSQICLKLSEKQGQHWEIEGTLQFNPGIFEQLSIDRMASSYAQLLTDATAHPECPVHQLRIVDPQQMKLLREWNSIEAPYALEGEVVSLFERTSLQNWQSLAVTDSRSAFSYMELNFRANQVAHMLRAMGIGRGAIVGVWLTRSPLLICCMLGIMKAGAAYLPLDVTHPTDRVLNVLRECGAAVLLTQASLRSLFSKNSMKIMEADVAGFASEFPGTNLSQRLMQSDCAYVIYTSGSTGTPKGVQISHRSLLNYILWFKHYYGLNPGDRASQIISPAFDASVSEIWPYLISGGSVIIADEETRLLPARLRNWLLEQRITMTKLITPLAESLLAEPWPPNCTLRNMLVGGEQLTRRPLTGTDFRVVNHYGPTEATVIATGGEVSSTDEGRLPDIGRPIYNYQIYILDPCLNLLPIGAIGEICIGGEGIALGYVRDPDPENPRFVDNPFGVGRLYRTGDLGRYLPDGRISFVGRTDQQVKIQGYRIELGEIKSALDQLTNVRESAVIVENTGGETCITAYVVPKSVADFEIRTIRTALRFKLPHYMIPGRFAVLDCLPLTTSGKLDRIALTRLGSSAVSKKHLEPQAALHKEIAGVWRRIVGISKVSIDESFFEVGGTSLLAAQAIVQLREQLRIDIPLAAIFEHPTIEELSSHLESIRQAERSRALVPKKPDRREHRASIAQTRLWLVHQMDPKSTAYNECEIYRLHGNVDVAALEYSLDTLAWRHESLRTSFHREGEELMQRILPAVPGQLLSRRDLSNLLPNEAELTLRDLMEQEVRRPFELETGPLFRCVLFRLSHELHALLLVLHHIISDGWSQRIMISEITELYESHLRQREPDLPALDIQYGDFADWQHEWLRGAELDRQVDYWRKQLAGAPDVLNLPTDYPRSLARDPQAATFHFVLPDPLTDDVRRISQLRRVTPFVLLLSGFQILMSRYSRQTELCVGAALTNRPWQQVHSLIGLFVNTVVLRTNLADNPTFAAHLDRTHDITMGAIKHPDLPFDQVIGLFRPNRSIGHTPFVQTMFSLEEDAPKLQLSTSGLKWFREGPPSTNAKFDLSLMFEMRTKAPRRIVGRFEFDANLFTLPTIQTMASCYISLLTSAACNPDTPIYDLPILDDSHRNIIVDQFNATATASDLSQDMTTLLETTAQLHASSLAVSGSDGQMTYREFNLEANRIAHFLRLQGVQCGSVVAIYAERSVAMLIAIVGTVKSGAAYLPIDASTPVERLRSMLSDSNAAVVLTQAPLKSLLPDDIVAFQIGDIGRLRDIPDTKPLARPASTDCAYVIYTSGSTGRPKGVMISRASLLNLILWHQRAYKVNVSCRASQVASAGFDASVWEIWPYLLSGASIHIVEDETRLSATRLQSWIIRNQITHAFVPTPIAEEFLHLTWPGKCTLRFLLVGGDRLTSRPSENIPFCVVNHYGPTEATVLATAGRVATRNEAMSFPDIGKPISNCCVYILDSYRQPVPVGVPGEIYIGGRGVAIGYVHELDPQHSPFIPNPFGSGRLYRTGDLGRFLEDGRIEFLARIDEQIKIRGHRVEPAEIKAVLDQQVGITESVVAVDNEPSGPIIGAYIVCSPGMNVDIPAIKAALGRVLPQYMLPSIIVPLASLPLTSSGKLDREELRRLRHEHINAGHAEPATPAEELLVMIWKAVLGLTKVGTHDNFFELGGNSLLATQVVARATRQGLYFAARDLFRHQTIAELAATAKSGFACLPTSATHDSAHYPLLPNQQWFFEQRLFYPTHWNTGMVFRVDESVDRSLLAIAIEKLVEQHDSLRLQFRQVDGDWMQYMNPQADFRLFQEMDFSLLDGTNQQRRLQEFFSCLQEGFSFGEGRLIRFGLVNLGDRGRRLAVLAHHLICDGVSLKVLIEDLSLIYVSLTHGGQAQLRHSTGNTGFLDWVLRLSSDAGLTCALNERNYWAPKEDVAIPVDFRGADNVMGSSEFVHIELDSDQSTTLLKLAHKQHKSSISVILLWAMADCLMKWQNRRSIAVNIVSSGRDPVWADIDLSRTVGWLNVYYPLVLRLPSHITAGDAISIVSEELNAVPNFGIGYGLLQYVHNRHNPLESIPLQKEPEVFFNYMGNLDVLFKKDVMFAPTGQQMGWDFHPQNQRPLKLGMFCYVIDGKIQADWFFSANLHAKQTIEMLNNQFGSNLEAFLEAAGEQSNSK